MTLQAGDNLADLRRIDDDGDHRHSVVDSNNVAFTEAYRKSRRAGTGLWIVGRDDEVSRRVGTRVFPSLSDLAEALAYSCPCREKRGSAGNRTQRGWRAFRPGLSTGNCSSPSLCSYRTLTDRMEIGLPGPSHPVLRVAHLVPSNRALTAYVALARHGFPALIFRLI